MKKLAFLFLILLLLGLNFSCSKKIDSEETIKKCKDECSENNNNDPDFCNRICEKEILDPRWKFFAFDKRGSAWFYDLESISTSHDIVPVWVKVIVPERARKNKKINFSLLFLQIDCSGKKYRWLQWIAYDSNDSIIDGVTYPENSTIWVPIPPNSLGELLSKIVCKK